MTLSSPSSQGTSVDSLSDLIPNYTINSAIQVQSGGHCYKPLIRPSAMVGGLLLTIGSLLVLGVFYTCSFSDGINIKYVPNSNSTRIENIDDFINNLKIEIETCAWLRFAEWLGIIVASGFLAKELCVCCARSKKIYDERKQKAAAETGEFV